MLVNNARSVSEALSQGLHILRVQGIPKPSRVGDVLVSPRPVMTEYSQPLNRVLLSPMRDANPFFHVMESLWMLAGRNDLPWLVRFNSRFASYSDDGGQTQPGAYGYRWRNYFGHDQLQDIILELKANPDTRRCVLAMWDGGSRATWTTQRPDFEQPGDFYAAVGGSADVPCNTHAYFDTIDGRLNMTVCCRSNDIIWGAYGANAVHFSFLLEYMSAMCGIPMGVYRQFSNNFHIYTNIVPRDELMVLARNVESTDPYLTPQSMGGSLKTFTVPSPRRVPLVSDGDIWESELAEFSAWDGSGPLGIEDRFTEPFFKGVAAPMYRAYIDGFKQKNYELALDYASSIKDDAWRRACVDWLTRRKIKAEVNAKPFTEIVPTVQDVPEENTFGLERSADHGAA